MVAILRAVEVGGIGRSRWHAGLEPTMMFGWSYFTASESQQECAIRRHIG